MNWEISLKKITPSISQGEKKIENTKKRLSNFQKNSQKEKKDTRGEAIFEELMTKIFPKEMKGICSQSRKHSKHQAEESKPCFRRW